MRKDCITEHASFGGRSEKAPCFLPKAAERKRAAKFPTGSQPCVSKSAGFAARRFILDMEYVL